MQPDPQLEAAWEKFIATLRDAIELSPWQIARTREIFTAGYDAGKKATR